MSSSVIYLGLDVHKESVTIAVLPGDAVAPTRVERLPNNLAKLRWFCERLQTGGGGIRACYEASGAGYGLQRAFASWGVACEVIAHRSFRPSPVTSASMTSMTSMTRRSLARLYRAANSRWSGSRVRQRSASGTSCVAAKSSSVKCSRAGTTSSSSWRGAGLCIARARRGAKGTTSGSGSWRARIRRSPRKIARCSASTSGSSSTSGPGVTSLDRQIAELALTPAVADAVQRLQCFRGLQVHGAMVLATELVDWRRVESPRQLMAYLSLVPREHSSGDRERRGALTKAGNSHCRHVLVAAELMQLVHLRDRRVPRRAQQRAAFDQQLPDARCVREHRIPLANQTRPEQRWQRRAIPEARRLRRTCASSPRRICTPPLSCHVVAHERPSPYPSPTLRERRGFGRMVLRRSSAVDLSGQPRLL
jgi:transposase